MGTNAEYALADGKRNAARSKRLVASGSMKPFPKLSRRAFQRAGLIAAAAAALPRGWEALAAGQPVEEALDLARARRAELVDLLAALVAVRSHSGESADAAQQVVIDYLDGLPYTVERFAEVPSRLAEHPEFMPPNPPGDGPFVNVIGTPDAGRRIPYGVFAHIDTEAVYDGWTKEPYELTEVDGRLHGLGTADDKGGIAAMLVAAAILAADGGPLPTVMSLHGKGGGSRGSLPVFSRFAREGTDFDAVLYSHPAETGHGLVDVKNVVQGALDLTLEVSGWRGEPLEMGGPESAPFDTGGDAARAAWGAIEHLRGTAFADRLVNVGEFAGGDRVGAVPDAARARIRILFEGEAAWRDLLQRAREELARYVTALGGEPGYAASLQQDGLATNPGAVSWTSPHAVGLRTAIEAVTGTAPSPYPNHYAGDIRYPIRLLGCPAFGIGSLGGNFYGPDEWVDIDDLVRLTAVIVEAVRRWAK